MFCGSSDETRYKFLKRVEETQLGKTWLSAYWSPWEDLKNKLKEIESTRAIMKIIRAEMTNYDSPHYRWFRDRFDSDDCSHYVTKLADEKIEEIEKLVVSTLSATNKNEVKELDL